MKTKNAVLTLVAMIVANAFTFAADATSTAKVAVVNQGNSGIFKVIYEGAKAGIVTLRIYDSNHNEIFAETERGLSKFMLPLNFSGLEQGEYSIAITDPSGTQIQKVNYKITDRPYRTQKLSDKEKSVKAVHITKLHEEGKYLMSVSTAGSSKVNVFIFDGNDNLIYNERRTVDGNVALVYNLKQVEGQPTFKVIGKRGK